MVEWKDEAVKAASKIVHENIRWREGGVGIKDSDLRASLDAAVKAQDMPVTIDYAIAYDQGSADGRALGRAEALEEAAKIVEACEGPHRYVDDMADAIRALKDKSHEP